MKRIIKLRTLIVLSLIIIMFSGCENILPPNDISGDNTDVQCPQAGYIYRGSSYNLFGLMDLVMVKETNTYLMILCN